MESTKYPKPANHLRSMSNKVILACGVILNVTGVAPCQQFHVSADREVFDASDGQEIPRPTFTLTIFNEEENPNMLRWEGTISPEVEYFDEEERFWPPFRTGDWIELSAGGEYVLFVYARIGLTTLNFWAVEDSAIHVEMNLRIIFPVQAPSEGGYLLVKSLSLSSYPNPFNSSTTITYSLPRPGRYALSVVDITGREVAKLGNGWREAGSYRAFGNGASLSSGQYRLILHTDRESFSRPITLVK